MPQTSLTAWLSKPAALQPPAPAKLPPQRVTKDDLGEHDGSAPDTVRNSLNASEYAQADAASNTTARARRPLPPNVELRACAKEDIPHFKRLNSLLLPIPYHEKFYREIIEDPLTSNITLVAVWHDDPANAGKQKGRLVGAIRCRILAHPPSDGPTSPARKAGPMLYLSTLVLLSPYRSHGIATEMLNILTKRAIQVHGVTSVGAHVWKANTDGLEWYRKRGFRVVGKEDGYYRRLKPTTAIVMQRDVGVMDFMEG
ncbi:uncharacterized protein LTR77_000196 [Saxophila tyrrhenica]|uniref:N-acetyltransferase domain-containing protein n=1 Tax=Saxophila tyrrhenica TaxID=1690608 RepID=A0AAV9PPT8_9PEZI|nr:hypothetical protein LTR77_000196 [Saxophila tyrrhenica]